MSGNGRPGLQAAGDGVRVCVRRNLELVEPEAPRMLRHALWQTLLYPDWPLCLLSSTIKKLFRRGSTIPARSNGLAGSLLQMTGLPGFKVVCSLHRAASPLAPLVRNMARKTVQRSTS